MDITYTLQDQNVTVSLSGEVDHHVAKQIITRLDSIIDLYMPKKLTLDLLGVSFMDSSGIAILVGAYRKQTAADCIMEVANVSKQPYKVLRAAGLERFFPIGQSPNL